MLPIIEKIVNVSSGGHSTFCVTENGELYSFGSNKHGWLFKIIYFEFNDINRATWASRSGHFTHSKKIVALKNILIVACGNWHTLALDNLGNVFGTGYNKHGSLGLGDQTNRTSFNMLKDIASKENEWNTNNLF